MKTAIVTFLGAIGTVVSAAAVPGVATAEQLASDWVGMEESRARLVSAVTAVGRHEALVLGLEIALAPGFKTYWRAGGSGGPPPSIDFRSSDNLAEAIVRWPAPEWHEVYDFDTIGYEDHVVFPIEVRLAEPGQPIDLRATAQWVACAEICIPIVEDVSLLVPAGPATASDDAELIERFLARVPGDGAAARLAVVSTALSGAPEEPVLSITVSATEEPLQSPDLFVEGPEDVVFSRPQVKLVADGWRAVFRVRAEDLWGERRPLDLTGEPLVITVIDGDRSMEAEITPAR